MRALGYIVGEVRTDAFVFVTSTELAPPRLEYIVVRGVPEPSGDAEQGVDVLAQVTNLSVSSRLLDTSLSYNEVEAIRRRLGMSPPIVLGEAKVLGYLDERGTVRLPRGAAMPGVEVYRAPDVLLRKFFSANVTSGIAIGTLINRPGVEVLLDPNGLRRHLAVIAQTGAGKSYTVGVILEQLLQLGGTVIVFDPNSDYVLMRRDRQQQATPFADRVQVYRLPTGQRRRISDEAIGGVERFQVQFSNLDPDEICDITGISEKATNIRKAVRTAVENLQGQDFTPQTLLKELQRLADGDRLPPPEADESFDAEAWIDTAPVPEVAEKPSPPPADEGPRITLDVISGAEKALKYIERLARVDVWGFEDVPMDRLLRSMSLSVIDLAGVDQWIADFVVDKVLRETWSRAVTEGLPYPAFIVLEEAHNFVPAGREIGRAGQIIKRIASEGRKFGIFLVLITQRPYRIHQDTLSQCNSQIIMRLTNPEDQNAVRRASESISEGLLADLPGLNVGEAVILGPLVRVPVMVRVGQRLSQEGGNDLDVVKALERARSEVVTEQMQAEAKAERAARGRTEWQEEV